MTRGRKILVGAAIVFGALTLWVAVDMADATPHDLRDFDGHEVGRLETAMWRSYYDHHPVSLFLQLIDLLRRQYHLTFWQSVTGAYLAAHAAVVFQKGHSHEDYARALPDLEDYYGLIRRSSSTEFHVPRAARLELDWWIIHRERAQHDPADLYRSLAQLQAEIYRVPEPAFVEHARIRGDAMLLRDDGGDWGRIGQLLDESWTSLQHAVAQK